ncbi:MAG: RNase adapter RapZ [Oscillospiraceae bacterium]|jgi:UPF0042 nucleotide-binding protein|nr:RNase adapter RapZ [Oscillospiraceae bacterium]
MRLLIVTGMSGAGKSKAVDALEDIGWFCVDNLPPRLVQTFAKLLQDSEAHHECAAVVIDARAGGAFLDVFWALDALTDEGVAYEVLFLDAADEVLARRYKETRRQHPLRTQNPAMGLMQAISAERKLLERLRMRAGMVIDTSQILPQECRRRIVELFAENPGQAMRVQITSFGFKSGTPRDCDLLFDVRCLPNPQYVSALQPHTGRENCIREYVLSFAESRMYLQKIADMLLFALPLYQKEGKSSLTVAFGCTGGKHRSVLFAEETTRLLLKNGYAVHVAHRDIAERQQP